MRFLRAAALTAILLVPVTAVETQAQLYNNGTPGGLSGRGAGGNEMTAWVQAQNFTLTEAATITGIRFWAGTGAATGLTGDTYSGVMFWAIANADNGANPGSLVTSNLNWTTRTLLGNNDFGGRTWQHDIAVNVPLSSGSYFLLLHNGPLTNINRVDYNWVNTAATAGNAPLGRQCLQPFPTPLSSCNWTSSSDADHAFQLFGTTQVVPEPSTYALMATGLAGLGLAARRRARR